MNLYGDLTVYAADIILSGGNINASGNDIVDLTEASFQAEYDNGNGSGAVTINWNNGNMQKITLTDNVTLSYTNPTGPGRFDLRIIQDVSGTNTVTWPGSQFWPGGTAPTITTDANAYDIVTIRYRGSSNYDGVFSQDFS